MSKMKYSGVEWIGNIPKEWNIKPLKSICDGFNNGCSNEQLQYGNSNYPVSRIETISTGVIDFDKVGYVEKIKDIYKLNKNDFLISNINSISYLGNCAIYDGKQVLYHGMNLLRVIPNKIYSNYLFYYFKSVIFRKYMQIYCKPAINQASVSATNLKSMKVPFPNKKEQILIANFLDKKSDELNQILNDLNKQIEILNSYKKSIITEKVTKGLNKNVVLKESKIDWMGKIPKHWKVKKMKYLGTARNGLTYTPDDQAEEGILVLRASNIQNGKLSLNNNVYVNMKVPPSIILKKNDLLICSRNGSSNLIGKNLLINDDMVGNTYGAFMCVFRSIYNQYIYYVLNSNIFDHYLNTFLTSTINQLTNTNLYNIKIPISLDVNEQEEIVEYLDKKCDQIDKIIENKQRQIEKIEEYKKSVIYEYVTGKKRVEGAEELYG